MPDQNQSDLPASQRPGEFRDPTSALYRAPPLPIGSPALVQHFAYRIPANYVDKPKKWLPHLQEFLNHLDKRLSKSDIESYVPNPVPICDDSNRRYRKARVRFSWQYIPVRLGIEVHHEYLALSTVMDLSKWKAGATTDEKSIAGKLNANIRAFDGIAKARNDDIEKGISRADRDSLKIVHQVIFTDDVPDDVWAAFNNEIFKEPLEEVGDKLGELFSAGRGFVASLADKNSESKSFILLPGHGIETERAKPGRPFAEHEDFRCAHTVLPLMRAGPGMEDLEYSVSQLDGNCLYVTALGAQPPELPNAPMATFLLLGTHPNSHQLGWLADRFCDLGTVRRGGLFDLPQLIKSDGLLRQLELKLEKIRAERPAQADDSKGVSAGFTKDDLSDAYKDLDKAARGGDGRKDSIQGGLLYRVNQSRTYWEQFSNLLDDLRIKPVGDFRVYSDLAHRRLGDTYGTIAAIGTHYRGLMESMIVYTRQLQANELHQIQMNLETEVGTITKLTNISVALQNTIAGLTAASVKEEKAARDLDEKIVKQTAASRAFLEFAELLAFCVFIPAAMIDFVWKSIGEEAWKGMGRLLQAGVLLLVVLISMIFWDVMLTFKPRKGEGERDSFIRRQWDRANLKELWCNRQRQWRVTKVMLKRKTPLKLRLHMKRAREARDTRLEGPFIG